MATKPKLIDVGEVLARELVFTRPNSNHRYLLQVPGVDYLETLNRFPQYDVKRTSAYYIEDTDGDWYACYNVDCFDPPMAIVRARSFEQAYETFCDEWSDWLKVNDADAGDYPEDDREYSSSGVHIDTSGVQLYPLTLIAITF